MWKEPFESPTPSLLLHEDLTNVLMLLFTRMDAIAAQCGEAFPLFARGDSNQWQTSAGGSWLGGFWAGCWWLRAKLTESITDQNQAIAICQRLASKTHADTVNRSLIFWYGAALGDRWCENPYAKNLASQAANALAMAYQPALQCIPLGTDMGGGAQGNGKISIDSLASVIQLASAYADDNDKGWLRQHADTVLNICRTANGAYHAEAEFNAGAWQASGVAGDWSRGQAWAMLACCRAAERWGEPYLSQAETACHYWLQTRPELIPPHHLSQAHCLVDPSAALIAALAMLSLADLVPQGNPWRKAAHERISAIIRSPYFTGAIPENSGIFWGCFYKTLPNQEELVESAWGVFFLMAGLGILIDGLDAKNI